MEVVPTTLKEANVFVREWHRHAKPTPRNGGRWAIALTHQGKVVGVAIVGRPISRELQKERGAAELLRLCTSPDCPKGGGSKLYARARRVWQLMGGTKFHTYTLERESGASMRGAGLKEPAASVKREQWNRRNRQRSERAIYTTPKVRWTETLEHVPL